ncbi:hypothetical protein Gogos_018342, partial [Gossypium gossypioides]|nr:hypothetical protein [Gossypium gossypioides]
RSEEDKSTISALTKECKERVSRFEATDFGYVPRQANEATHGLAKEGRRYESSMYWIEEAPVRVEELEVGKDLLLFSTDGDSEMRGGEKAGEFYPQF